MSTGSRVEGEENEEEEEENQKKGMEFDRVLKKKKESNYFSCLAWQFDNNVYLENLRMLLLSVL